MEKYKPFKAIIVVALCLLLSSRLANAFDPITTAFSMVAAGAASFILGGFDIVACKLRECCNDQWIPQNISGWINAFST